MKNHTKILFLSLCAPLLLTGCGEGWEFKKTDQLFPYGNQRTAGSGVAYVLAKMMPEKELKLEPVMQMEPVKEPEAQPVLDAEEIFVEEQVKGAALTTSPKTEQTASVAVEQGVDHFTNETQHAEAVPAAGVESNVLDEVVAQETGELTAEQYIAQAPKQVDIPEVQIVDTETSSISQVSEELRVYEQTLTQSASELVAPKQDYNGYKSVGQESLEEIYTSPF